MASDTVPPGHRWASYHATRLLVSSINRQIGHFRAHLSSSGDDEWECYEGGVLLRCWPVFSGDMSVVICLVKLCEAGAAGYLRITPSPVLGAGGALSVEDVGCGAVDVECNGCRVWWTWGAFLKMAWIAASEAMEMGTCTGRSTAWGMYGECMSSA